jgi:pyochelin synthetase
MNVGDLLGELRAQGIRLWEDDGELRFRAPKGVMTTELRETLRQSKAAILGHMRSHTEVQLVPSPEACCEPFPLTDIQVAYILGRRDSFSYGGVGCHGYGEIALPDFDSARLNRAWGIIVERHDMLRAVMLADGTQHVLDEVPAFTIDILDLRQSEPGPANAELRAVRARMAHRVYQPEQWPLFDLHVTITPTVAILHFSIDLLIADFVSTQIILDELEQLLADDSASLPPIEVSYRDYVIAAQSVRQSEEFAASRRYWMKRLDELPPAPDLPLIHEAPAHAPRFERHDLELFPEHWTALCSHARKLELTPSTAVLALFAEIVARWSSQPHFTLNVTLQNRLPLHPGIDRIVGDFTAVELLAVRHDPELQLRDRADALQKRLWEDLDHRAFSGTDIIRELARSNHPGAAGFPVVFTSSIGLGTGSAAPRRGLGKLLYGITQTPQVWIDCQAIEDRGALKINWDVREGVFPPGLIEAMFESFRALLVRACGGTSIWDETAPIQIPAALIERRRDAADSEAAQPCLLLHEGVVEQALHHPDRPAVIAAEMGLTFGELLAHAAGVAAAVRECGHSPGDCVAVMLEPGWEQPVAALGVLLAGCAYLPLDPDEPPTRRRGLLERLKVRSVLIGSAEPTHEIGPPEIQAISIAGLAPKEPPGGMPARPTTGDGVAYVIADLDSADRLEAIAVSHASAASTFSAINARFAVGRSDRVLAVSSPADCMSAYTLFGVLATGACLVMPRPERRQDPAHWIELIRTQEVTVWGSAPALLDRLCVHVAAEPGGATMPALRLALLTGARIPAKVQPRARDLFPELRLGALAGADAGLWSIVHQMEEPPRHWSGLACGEPILRDRLRVLDDGLSDRLDWVAGSLFSADESGKRLHRTGVRARYRADGLIELLGREERYRMLRGGGGVQLDEVEAALATDPLVARAAVLVQASATVNPRLVAFIEPARQPDGLPDAIRARLVAVTRQAAARVPPPDFDADLDSAVRGSIGYALRARGLLEPGSSVEALTPPHRRLVRRCRRLLERAEPVGPDRDGVAAQWRRVAQKWEDDRDKLDLTTLCNAMADRLPDILGGGGELSAIMPGRLVDAARTRAPLARWAGQCIATAVAELRATCANPLRILELGGISGVSLDLNRRSRDQGFHPHSFDVIVSHSALHAVRDIEAGMSELVELLSPDGWMVFSEPVRDQDWVVGTLECLLELDTATGDFLDRRAGRDQTSVSAEEWRDLIVRNGGELITSTASDDHRMPSPSIAVFAARFAAGQASLEPWDLIAAAQRWLPAYMVPDNIELLSCLPLTAKAEIDYRRLENRLSTPDPAPRRARTAGLGELEDKVAALWSEVLQTARIDYTEGFLAAGGDSLKAARLAGRMRERIPEASKLYFDELLQAILKGGTVAGLAVALEKASGRSEARNAREAEIRPAVTTREFGGTGKTTWVIVPDNLVGLNDTRRIAEPLRKQNVVLGIEIDNAEEFLRLSVKTLVANTASLCLDRIIGDGHLSIAVLGIGQGCPFALELARQMSDAGGVTRQLVLAPNMMPLGKCAPIDQRLQQHSTAACHAWDPPAYAGDMMLVLPRDTLAGEQEQANRWSTLCLGALRVVALADDAPAAVADAIMASEQQNDAP